MVVMTSVILIESVPKHLVCGTVSVISGMSANVCVDTDM